MVNGHSRCCQLRFRCTCTSFLHLRSRPPLPAVLSKPTSLSSFRFYPLLLSYPPSPNPSEPQQPLHPMRKPLGSELRPLHLPVRGLRSAESAMQSLKLHCVPCGSAPGSTEGDDLRRACANVYFEVWRVPQPPVLGSPFLKVTLGFKRALSSCRSWNWEQLPQASLSNSS